MSYRVSGGLGHAHGLGLVKTDFTCTTVLLYLIAFFIYKETIDVVGVVGIAITALGITLVQININARKIC
ncbi:MAG: hypothetical protein NTW08_01775 [Gammaproteobacteria bacterium]|nr:hypothetical protein [Gammaproteobacteria bacterium]